MALEVSAADVVVETGDPACDAYGARIATLLACKTTPQETKEWTEQEFEDTLALPTKLRVDEGYCAVRSSLLDLVGQAVHCRL